MNGDDEAQNKLRSVLSYVLDKIMKMLHPFMPLLQKQSGKVYLMKVKL